MSNTKWGLIGCMCDNNNYRRKVHDVTGSWGWDMGRAGGREKGGDDMNTVFMHEILKI